MTMPLTCGNMVVVAERPPQPQALIVQRLSERGFSRVPGLKDSGTEV